MYLDTFGNEAINGWDGTALDTGEGGYVFAPQVGAGEKDSNNKFTGVVMGKDSGQDKIGLYGYQSGVNTFGLMEDGKAFFGAKSGGGQIVIDGTSAIISGGGTEVDSKGEISTLAKNGMYLRLANKDIEGTTKAIGIGLLDNKNENKKEENFYVTYDGKLKANSATVNGAIYAETGQIGCSGEYSTDGWFIKTHRLYSGSGSTRVEFNSNEAMKKDENGNPTSDLEEPMAIWAGNDDSDIAKNKCFAVSKKGDLYVRSGNIGGWVLTTNALTSSNNKIGLNSVAQYCFWSGADENGQANSPTFNNGESFFYVKNDGTMSCKNASISGKIEANKGVIGGWKIGETTISAGQTELSVDDKGNGSITTNTFIIKGKEDSSIDPINIGSIGTIVGSNGVTDTLNLGLSTNGLKPTRSIILLSSENIRLSTPSSKVIYLEGNTYIKNNSLNVDGGVTIGGGASIKGNVSITGSNSDSKLSCTISAKNQTGIYARFA